ncbi:unnamed protein product [Timema podura]|uniref:C2H2-type domain-containing protein n=1 Tax=Timema podura TaxID=61482 RepID=A0ABN7P0F4_TIMPD|nr:unnamed protein product [Timema podura]
MKSLPTVDIGFATSASLKGIKDFKIFSSEMPIHNHSQHDSESIVSVQPFIPKLTLCGVIRAKYDGLTCHFMPGMNNPTCLIFRSDDMPKLTVYEQIFRHLKYIHRILSSKILDSDVCKKVLPSSGMLAQQKEECVLHSATEINSQHSSTKRGCSKCSVSCGNLSSLKLHNLVHTGERPFHCSECNRSFRRQTELFNNMLLTMFTAPLRKERITRAGSKTFCTDNFGPSVDDLGSLHGSPRTII